MNQNKHKTQKIMDLHVGELHFELILDLDNPNDTPVRIYQIGYRPDANTDYPVRYKELIAKVPNVITALDIIRDDITTYAWKNRLDQRRKAQ